VILVAGFRICHVDSVGRIFKLT